MTEIPERKKVVDRINERQEYLTAGVLKEIAKVLENAQKLPVHWTPTANQAECLENVRLRLEARGWTVSVFRGDQRDRDADCWVIE